MQPDFKHFIRICDNINRTITRIPHKAAVLAVNFSKERFIKKNWLDDREYPWPKTKKRKGSTLIKSGRLKRSIRQVHVGADYAIIGTDVPYARAHNDGLTVEGTETVRATIEKAISAKPIPVLVNESKQELSVLIALNLIPEKSNVPLRNVSL